MKIEWHKCDRCGAEFNDQEHYRLLTYSDFEAKGVTVELCPVCRESFIEWLAEPTTTSESLMLPLTEDFTVDVPTAAIRMEEDLSRESGCICYIGQQGFIPVPMCPVHGTPEPEQLESD